MLSVPGLRTPPLKTVHGDNLRLEVNRVSQLLVRAAYLQQPKLNCRSFICYLVAVVFDQLKDESSIHEGKQVIEEKCQADVDFLRLLYFLKKTKKTKQKKATQQNQSIFCRTEWILSTFR